MYKEAFEEAKKHAIAMFPEEMCGFVVDGKFVPVQNAALPRDQHTTEGQCGCRLCMFVISPEDNAKWLPKAQMVLHSHPNGPLFPSETDMFFQMMSNIPWGVVALDEDRIGEFEIWGDTLPIADLIGRTFMHGIRDCYSLVRDTFRLGKDRLKEMDVTQSWPFDPIVLTDMARDDCWWGKPDCNFYEDHLQTVGFKKINREDARPGDCFLLKINSPKLNHAGIMISDDLILHHLPNRLSRREPMGLWARTAEVWVRYVGDQK